MKAISESGINEITWSNLFILPLRSPETFRKLTYCRSPVSLTANASKASVHRISFSEGPNRLERCALLRTLYLAWGHFHPTCENCKSMCLRYVLKIGIFLVCVPPWFNLINTLWGLVAQPLKFAVFLEVPCALLCPEVSWVLGRVSYCRREVSGNMLGDP